MPFRGKILHMKVGIDVGALAYSGARYGMGTYTHELLTALEKEAKDSDVQIDRINASKSSLGKYDVVHFTKFRPFFLSLPFTKPGGTKFVLTIYDLIPLIYPKHYPPGIRGWLKWQINKFLIRKNIDAIITISETSKKDICRIIGINSSKVHVTYLAAPKIYREIKDKRSLERIRKEYKLPEKFALSVTDVYYSKNVPNLMKACRDINFPLVIVNKNADAIRKKRTDELSHPELRHLNSIDWSGVVTIGEIRTVDLVKIYNLASIYIQASLYEGFGIPLIQAFACGTPAVATNVPTLIEIAEGGALFADPKSAEDISAKVQAVLGDDVLRNQLVATASVIAKSYNWHKTANKTLQIYINIQQYS